VTYLSKFEIISRKDGNIYSYFAFVEKEFTCKLHTSILKFYSGIFPYRGFFNTMRSGFETHQNGLRLLNILTPIVYLAINKKKMLNNA